MSSTEISLSAADGITPQKNALSLDEDTKLQVVEDADDLQLVSALHWKTYEFITRHRAYTQPGKHWVQASKLCCLQFFNSHF
jgi:hypothetical protein